MARSRLISVKEKKELKQAIALIAVTIFLLVGFVFWGLPAVASFVGSTFIKNTDPETIKSLEIKPTVPIFSDIPESTNSAELSFGGYGQPGVSIEIYINSEQVVSTMVEDSGTFAVSDLPLVDGENILYAFAKNPTTELESDKSREYIVNVDKSQPVLTINEPSDGSTFRRESERIVAIKGSVNEEGTKVTVGDRLAIVSSDMSFAVDYQLIEGDQEIVVRAIDRAGNETIQTLRLRWEK